MIITKIKQFLVSEITDCYIVFQDIETYERKIMSRKCLEKIDFQIDQKYEVYVFIHEKGYNTFYGNWKLLNNKSNWINGF